MAITVPAIGARISTALVGHDIDERVSSRISRPGLTLSTISASVVPSPISGTLTM
jgi:hypothetical protein